MAEGAAGRWPGRRLAELRLAVAFLTRLPVGRIDPAPPLAQALWALPLAGAVAALLPAAVFLIAAEALPLAMASILAIAAGVMVSGALHEDGLADVADGLGGRTIERRLEIMRDSRLGSFGVLALIAAFALRVAGLTAVAGAAEDAGAAGALALLALAAASRAPLPAVMALVPAARRDGLAAGNVPPRGVWLWSLGLGAAALALTPAPLAGCAALALAVSGVVGLACRRFGGQTGDVLGAAQQAGEVALWIVLAAQAA